MEDKGDWCVEGRSVLTRAVVGVGACSAWVVGRRRRKLGAGRAARGQPQAAVASVRAARVLSARTQVVALEAKRDVGAAEGEVMATRVRRESLVKFILEEGEWFGCVCVFVCGIGVGRRSEKVSKEGEKGLYCARATASLVGRGAHV